MLRGRRAAGRHRNRGGCKAAGAAAAAVAKHGDRVGTRARGHGGWERRGPARRTAGREDPSQRSRLTTLRAAPSGKLSSERLRAHTEFPVPREQVPWRRSRSQTSEGPTETRRARLGGRDAEGADRAASTARPAVVVEVAHYGGLDDAQVAHVQAGRQRRHHVAAVIHLPSVEAPAVSIARASLRPPAARRRAATRTTRHGSGPSRPRPSAPR